MRLVMIMETEMFTFNITFVNILLHSVTMIQMTMDITLMKMGIALIYQELRCQILVSLLSTLLFPR